MTNYNCIGKTLSEIAKETPISFSGGYSVFLLQDETDTTGKKIDISYSVMAILEKHPEIANYKVKFENDFYGMTVLRVTRSFKMTNYDRIKAMSVEEMALLLCNCSDCGNGRCYGNDLCTQGDGACNGLVKWLEQEVSE